MIKIDGYYYFTCKTQTIIKTRDTNLIKMSTKDK